MQKFTKKAANALKLAAKAARRRGHSYIGSEHLLLGLLEEQEGTAAQVLMGAGVEEETSMPPTAISGVGESSFFRKICQSNREERMRTACSKS